MYKRKQKMNIEGLKKRIGELSIKEKQELIK